MLYPPPSVTVHILHDDTLSADNRDKFSYIAGRYGQLIKFYNVEKICAAEVERIKELFKNYPKFNRFTVGAIYRLLSAQILSEDINKIIYLDGDVIVNLDINELWKINIKNKPLAGVPEISNGMNPIVHFPLCRSVVEPENYFNSGVLIMNLKKIRQDGMENLWDGMKFLAENPQYICFDQEILNYCFSTNYLKLPLKFNCFAGRSRKRGEFDTDNRIWHYAGGNLNLDLEDNFNRLWFKYFVMTPFFNENVIAHLNEGYKQILTQVDTGLKNLAVQISALMAGKTRAFFTASQNVDGLKNFFGVKDDEEIIPLVNQESFQTLEKSMTESRGKKIFFILFEHYGKLRDELIKLDFVEGQDFIDAAMFLTYANGVPVNTYSLIKAM